MSKLLVICGPTATGKTTLALQLAKKFNGEVVSADSRQIYRGMDIGTGKDLPRKFTDHTSHSRNWDFFNSGNENPALRDCVWSVNLKNKNFQLKPYILSGIPLWMYDVVDPDEEFSVSHYEKLAIRVIEDIRKRGKLPIVVGGTGLYIQSLLSPLETSHIPPNSILRKSLENKSLHDLQSLLQETSPLLWKTMNDSDRQNPRRLMRKIEMTEYYRHPALASPIGADRRSWDAGSREENLDSCFRRNDINEDVLLIGLTAPYPVLYKQIDKRVDKRVKQGIVKEIQMLLKKGYTWNLPSMNTFGYKEWKEYFTMLHAKCQMLNKKQILRNIIQRWKWGEHGYARRQMTWFKKMKGIQWTNITEDGWQEKVETKVGTWYTG